MELSFVLTVITVTAAAVAVVFALLAIKWSK